MINKLLKEEIRRIYAEKILSEQWWKAIIPELEQLEGTALAGSEKAAMQKAGIEGAQVIDDVLNLVKSKAGQFSQKEINAVLTVCEKRGMTNLTNQILDSIVKTPANAKIIQALASNDERLVLSTKGRLIDDGFPREALDGLEQKAKGAGGRIKTPNAKTSPIHINKLNVNLEEALTKNVADMTDAEVAVVGSEVANFGKNMVDFAMGKQGVLAQAEKLGLDKAKTMAEIEKIRTETEILKQQSNAQIKKIEAETSSIKVDTQGKQISNIKSNIPLRKQVNVFFTILASSTAFYVVYKYLGSPLLAFIRGQNKDQEGVARTILKRVIQAKPENQQTNQTTQPETQPTSDVRDLLIAADKRFSTLRDRMKVIGDNRVQIGNHIFRYEDGKIITEK